MKKSIILIITSIAFIYFPSFSQQHFDENKGVVSHRGAWKEFNIPENSRGSFKKALELGCKGTELDVWRSADGVLVVNHNKDHQGLIIENTKYKDLKKVKLKNGETIPTLSYFLKKIAKQNKTTLIIDVKSSQISTENTKILAQKCIEEVRKYKAQDKVEYLFGNYEAGKHAVSIDPTAKISLLGWKTICAPELNLTAEQVKKEGFYGLDLNYKAYIERPEYIEEAKRLGLTLNAWTVNEIEDMKWFIEKGFDYITTDKPELLLSIWK